MAMSESEVEIMSKEMIKPSFPTLAAAADHSLKKSLKLSFFDKLNSSFSIHLVFFYKNHPNITSQQLKQSLSETLTIFYPFAGRINEENDLIIDCNDSGVLFVEAQVHNSNLSDAIQSSKTDDIYKYLPINYIETTDDDDDDDDEPPLMAVQMSFFQCGGIAIGVCLSHTVADMHTFSTFMNSWASICSSSRGIKTSEITIVQPNFEVGYNLFPPLIDDYIRKQVAKDEYDQSFAEEKIRVMKRFVFDKETLEEMKQIVSSKSSCLNDPTKVEMVSAFIWKHIIDITIAKNPTTKIRSFGAFHVVDLRRRLSLPSLSNAMGNFGILTLAKWGEELEYFLADQKDRDYCNLVTLLRTAIRRKDYNDYIGNEEKQMEFFHFRTQSDPEMECCFFTSWCKLPFYQVDYGWGKPFAICHPVLPVKNIVTLMDTKSGDGIEATITMTEDEMAMLPTQFLDLENNDFSK